MIMVYVIKSKSRNFRYIGITSNLKIRLKQHNSNKSLATKNRGPFEIIFSEPCTDYGAARKREKKLKTGVGRKFLDSLEK